MDGSINRLTDLAIKNAKPGKSPRRIADGGGLFFRDNSERLQVVVRRLRESGIDKGVEKRA